MDIKTRIKITNLLNHAFNLLECDSEQHKFRELGELIWNARNLSTWMLIMTSTEVDGERVRKVVSRNRDDWLDCVSMILDEEGYSDEE